MEYFKIGDVVILKSSTEINLNPLMTVSEVGTMISCVWFDKNDELQYANFPAECLIKVK